MINSFSSLTMEERIGQLLFIGLPGSELDSESRALLREITPGGVIIFGRNVSSPQQLRRLLDGIPELLHIPPLLGIDQEGGLVDRLRAICTPMPAARVIRQHGDLAGARALGRITGQVLRILGFNMNFAPVMSIMSEDRDIFANGLHSRSFGRSPGEVLGYTMVYMRGLQGTGCLGCIKHFPGIGAGKVDSHEEMPLIPLTHDDLIAQDIAAYIELFQREDNMVKAVMVSHGGYPNINIRKATTGGLIEPASISYDIVTELLRHELGFQGLAVTDDLEMGAISKDRNIEEAVVRAVNAGEDMLLICARPDYIRRGHQALLAAVRGGILSERRINESLERIHQFKTLTSPPLAFDLTRYNELCEEIRQLNTKLNYSYGGKS